MPRLTTLRPAVRALDQRTAKEPLKRAEPFYLSPEWRGLVADIRAQRPACCQDCERRNTRLFADHVVELKDGGAALDPRNVKLLCGSCHGRKTALARTERQAQRHEGAGAGQKV